MRHDTADSVANHLEGAGWDVVRCGAVGGPDTPWPEVAEDVARQIAEHEVDEAVVCCWTGTGVSIAANKVPGVRAALCRDAQTAEGARMWNDANVLALSLAATDAETAKEIVDAWLRVHDIDPEEADNIDAVAALEFRYRGSAEHHSVERDPEVSATRR